MTETRAVPATPEPVEQSDDLNGGVTTWDVDPFEVTATVGRSQLGEAPISIDGRQISPAKARVLAAVLLSAADRVDGVPYRGSR